MNGHVNMPEGHEQCPRCQGLGEVLVASRHIGGGCFNDEWGICPKCNTRGYVPSQPEYHALDQDAYDQLRNHLTHGYWLAVTAWLEHQNSTTEATLTAAIKALGALGLDEREYRRKADALLEERRSTWAQSAEELTALELERLL